MCETVLSDEGSMKSVTNNLPLFVSLIFRRRRAIVGAVAMGMALASASMVSRAVSLRAIPSARQPASPTKSVWDAVYSDPQAKRGEALYRQECGVCHGDDLRGIEAPPLAGESFLSSWNGLMVGELFERISVTMPLTNPGGLSRQAYADIVAHILKANMFPAGEMELASDIAVLKQVKIESKPQGK